MKPSGQDGSSKGKFDAAMNKRKLESSSKQPVGAKQKSATTKAEVHAAVPRASWRFLSVGKEAFDIIVKSKTSSSSSKTSTTTKAKVREKKVYTLPGQKHDPPEEHLFDVLQAAQFDLRASSVEVPLFLCDASLFFGHYDNYCLMWFRRFDPNEDNYLQKDDGTWLVVPRKDRKAYEKKQRRQKQLRTGTPIKSWKPSGKPESSQKQQLASRNGDVKAKKRINNDIDDDDDDDDDFILSPKRRKG
ncbi:hypothetical protein Golax_023133 [Gossypium laxum]|uniref:Uncharacterized protein n=1 Tax=Gossypium laxum TaxID=34288 RepID=A0A7J9B367_9ROSI|nr:hypothetical protein [Gossypium laxum]